MALRSLLDPGQGRELYLRHAAPPTTTKDSPAKLASRMKRRWRVVLLRNKGEILGTVEAPDVAVAGSRGGPVRPGRHPAQPDHGAGAWDLKRGKAVSVMLGRRERTISNTPLARLGGVR